MIRKRLYKKAQALQELYDTKSEVEEKFQKMVQSQLRKPVDQALFDKLHNRQKRLDDAGAMARDFFWEEVQIARRAHMDNINRDSYTMYLQ